MERSIKTDGTVLEGVMGTRGKNPRLPTTALPFAWMQCGLEINQLFKMYVLISRENRKGFTVLVL